MPVFSANGFIITDFANLPFVYCLLFTSHSLSRLSLSPLAPTLFLKRLHLLLMNHISLRFSVSPFHSLSCQTHSCIEIIRTSEEMESVSGAARLPCFIDEDDGLASVADMEAGFSGSNHPFFSRPMCFARRNGSFRNVSPAMASFSSSSSFSPRSGRFFCDARFEEHHQPHFLDACFLCKKPLGDNRDIFMYRGDTPFCSEECRDEQIEIDEAKEKNWNLSSSMKALRKREQRKSNNSANTATAQDYAVHTGTVAAA